MKPMFILDRNEEIVAVLSGNADDSGCHFFNAILTLELSKGSSLTFEVDSTESDVVEHIKEENMVVVHDGENYRLLIIKEISDTHEDDCMKEVYCEDASAELIDEIIYDEISGKVEMGIVLASILKGTRWEIGEVDNTYIRNLKSEYKLRTVLNGIQTLANDYDAEIDFTVEFAGNKIVSRKVHMKKAFGRTLGKRFEFGKDITSIKRTISTADIKTAVVPFGATDEETGEVLTIKDVSWSKPTNSLNKPLGQIYIEDEEATELWGYKGTGSKRRPRWVAITFEDCTDADELLNYAYLQLNRFNKPKVSYEAEVNDLYRMSGSEDYAHEKVGLGDLCNIIDHNFVPALALESRVVKLELDLNDTSNSKVTLGTIVESIVDKDLKTQIEELNVKVSAVASNVDLTDIEDRLDSLESETGTGKWEQIQEVNNLLFGNAVGYHYMSADNGIWVFDKPVNENPTKAVALKGGCIGLAKWDSQKQEWKVGTFIDGNSVNASMINTGTLKADRIEANALTVNHFNQELKTIINSVGDKPSKTEVTTAIKTAVDEINLSVSTKYSTKSETESMKTTAITESKSYADTKKQEAITTASTDATNKVNSAKTELNKTIDNIQVGGRNLYSKSKTPVAILSSKGSCSKDVSGAENGFKLTSSGGVHFRVRCITQGIGNYTISFYIKSSTNSTIQIDLNDSGYKVINTATSYQKIVHTVNNIKEYSETYNFIDFESGATSGVEFYIKDFKVETGTKATDWTPAIEDVDSEINKKANSTDVYTKTETYTKAQTDSAIKVARDEINLGISSTYETKTNVETKISTAVNSVQIGGRNYIRDYKFKSEDIWKKSRSEAKVDIVNGYGYLTGTTENPYLYQDLEAGLIKKGDVLTLQYEVKFDGVSGSTGTNTFLVRTQLSGYLNNGSYVQDIGIFGKHDSDGLYSEEGWQKVTKTITITSDAVFEFARFRLYARNFTGSIYFRNVKLEKGNKATDLSEAPEDVDSAIDSKANSTDVYKKSETYTKSETDSAIKVAKDAIDLSVSTTYETKTNVASTVNSAKTDAINTSKSYADTKKKEAIDSANASTDTKLKSYSTTTQMDSAIKLAKDNITSTVSQTYLSKGDATNTYATKSSLTQTSNSITASFSSSGGSNVIRNSQFKNGLTYWTNWGTCTRNIGNWNIHGAKCDTAIQMLVTGNNQGVQQSLENLAIGQPYTVRAMMYVGSGGQPCIMFYRNNTWWTWTWPTSNGTGKWHEIAFEYTPTTSTDTIYIGNSASGKAGTFYFTSISMTLGVMKDSATNNVIIPNWTPHPSEIYDGSTVIDASGVTIKNGALKVQNNAEQTVLSGDSNGNLSLKSIGTGLSTDIASGKMTLTNTSTGAHMDLQGTTIKLYDTSTIDERAEIVKSTGDLTISSWSQKQTPTISLNTDTVKVSNKLSVGGALISSSNGEFGGYVKCSRINVTGSATDLVNNSPWYGMGKADVNLGSDRTECIQVAGHFGLRLRSANSVFDLYYNNTIKSNSTIQAQNDSAIPGYEAYRGNGHSRLSQANTTGDLRLELFSSGSTVSRQYLFASSTFYPTGSPTLGHSNYRWGQIYSTSGSISTSDSKVKENIKPVARAEARMISFDDEGEAEATSYDFYNYVKNTSTYTFNYRREYNPDNQTWLGVLADEIPDNIFDRIGMMSKSEEDYQKELQEQEEAKTILEATPIPVSEDEDVLKDYGNRIVEGTSLTYRELEEKAKAQVEEPIRMINSSSQIAMLQEVLSIALNKIELLEQRNLELEKDLEEIKGKLGI